MKARWWLGGAVAALPWLQGPVSAEEDLWSAGLYVDLAYAEAFQTGRRIPWRSKATTQRLNQFSPNLGMFYLRKQASAASPWGWELAGQAGYDTDGQVPARERLPGYSVLRYLSRANVTYRVPVGNGLTLTGGLMNSFIGFESFYAKDNFNYTRSWIADYSPYFLLGVGARYPFGERLAVGFYLLSDYDYLAHRNNQPKYGAQLAWTLGSEWQLTQNLFLGPEQSDTAPAFWRYFSDTILQWSGQALTVALAYDVGTERLRAEAGQRQTLWMGSALFTRWHLGGPWSLAVRPEFYWDPDGRLTGARQLLHAVTVTLEYRVPVGSGTVGLRAEYRYDNSTGKEGGFFQPRAGGLELIPTQQAFFISGWFSYDVR
ncbi:outer membrane beta-barrel protein [Candidatus Methylocalor cossyra]|uniref:Porin n=1 Tax=Candidatus Methylocalor cossyra TaxID=3108543 RepID=A0ABP1C6F8_9GAMM